MTPVQVDDRVEDGVRVAIHYDAGIYDGSCALTVTAARTGPEPAKNMPAFIVSISLAIIATAVRGVRDV